MYRAVDLVVQPRQLAHGLERIEEVAKRTPGLTSQRGYASERDLAGVSVEPAPQFRFEQVARPATIKEELDDLDALAPDGRRLKRPVILSLDQLRAGTGRREQQAKRGSERLPAHVGSQCWE